MADLPSLDNQRRMRKLNVERNSGTWTSTRENKFCLAWIWETGQSLKHRCPKCKWTLESEDQRKVRVEAINLGV